MAQNTNLNVSPYYDDFSRDKNFHKLLFRPGYSIQSRELTTLQSILQDQIEKYGTYQFKQGDLVIPGEVGLNTRLDFVKLSSVSEVAINVDGEIVFQKYDIRQLVGQRLVGISSGVQGVVLDAQLQTETSSDTIFVSYVGSGDSNAEDTFRQGEFLEVVNGVNTPVLTVGTDGAVLPNFINITNVDTGEVTTEFSPALGFASAVNISKGVYFVNGFFVDNDEQLVIVDPYNNKASGKVSFDIVESIITADEDSSLLDNSRGSSNFSSPGANRLKIELSAKSTGYTELLDKNSILLLSIKNGVVEKKIKPKDYNVIEDTLARRTYDESGDYVVKDFSFNVREYLQDDDNDGLYVLNQSTNLVNGISLSEAKSKLVGTIGPGKAYVKGYEIVNKETKYVEIDKARDTVTRSNVRLKFNGFSSFYVTNVFGSVPVNAEGVELTAYPTIFLLNTLNDGNIGLNGLTSDYKNTKNGRGELISDGPLDVNAVDLDLNISDIAIKTIWVERSTLKLPNYDETFLPAVGSYLWVIKSYAQEEGSNEVRTALVDKVRILSSALVTNEKVNPGSALRYAEFVVTGRRDIVDALFTEFDTSDVDQKRRVFISSADAFDVNQIPVEDENGDPIFPPLIRDNYIWGSIVDYTETLSPLVGVTKPSNFYSIQTGEGFNKLKDKVFSKGSVDNQEVYNAIFNLSYFNPQFFTRITLEENIGTGFSAGKYVTGLTSGAFGVVEGVLGGYYSSTNTLHLNVQQGTFQEGETIVDEDGEIVKIARSNTISHFVVHNQGDNFDQSSVVSLNGITFDKSKISVNRVQDGVQIGSLTIQDSSVREIEYSNPPEVSVSSGIGEVITSVLFKNTVYTYESEDVKSFYCKYGSGTQGENIFTADTDTENSEYSSFRNITNSTFNGIKGENYLTINALAIDLGLLLRKGDLIQYVEANGTVRRAIVVYATTSSGNVKSRIYLDSVLRDDVVNTGVLKISSKIENPKSSLVFKTGSSNVARISDDITDSKISYFFRRDFVASGSSSGGTLTFAAQLPFGTQRFVRFTNKNFIITILDPGVGDQLSTTKGDIVYIKPEFISIDNSTDSESGLVAGTARVTFPEDFFGTNMTEYPKVKLTATLEVSKAKPKLKTFVENKRIVVSSANDKVIPIRGQDYDTSDIGIFSYADVVKLRYVYEGSLISPPRVDATGILVEGKDRTNDYIFDDGQRLTFYDVARLVLKPGVTSPTGQLVIGFDYFEHSQGEFCTVDSYIHESGVDIQDIPYFQSPEGSISLADVIDFRPKVDSLTITPGFQDNALLSTANYVSFAGAGGAPSVSPAPDSNLEYTVKLNETSYLDRIDALFLNKEGNFILKKGNSSKNPSKPDLVADSVPLSYIYIPALTRDSSDVRLVPVDNKRYTMKDISKLEKRVERLEYYTALSILEQQTLNMQIKDDLGLDRFKSGFFVDNFETHGVGDISSTEYKCAIDSQQAILRPEVYEENVSLKENNTREDQRLIDNYKNTNGMITLPYTSIRLLGNNSATTTVNPNPFVVLQYVGDINVNPTIDTWYNTNITPLVTDNNTNLFSTFVSKKGDPASAFASIYNSFLINWSGVDQTFGSINSVSSSNTVSATSNSTDSFIASSSNISPDNNEIGKGVSVTTTGSGSVVNSIQLFARSIPIKFVVTRMKPLTTIYPFIDGRDVSRWTISDNSFSGVPTSSLSTFGSQITTDEFGNASGLILLPAGYPPIQGTGWTGDIQDVAYDTSAERILLTTGQKSIRFTSSATNAPKDEVISYAEINFYSQGTKPDNPQSIISTQPAYFKSNEGIQFVESNTDLKVKPNPLAQTFRIENYDGGLFTTGLDLYFSKKSESIPVKVYLSDMNAGKPGKNIVPGSEKVLLPKTYLKVTCSGNISIGKGDTLEGSTSGCKGPLEKIIDQQGNEVALISGTTYNLNNEQVYTFILSNHNGKVFQQNEFLTSSAIELFNNTRNTNITIKIVKDYGKVTKFIIDNVGTNYQGAVITVESPQLPGETSAAAFPYISGGVIYDVDVSLSGSGYTDPPSVIVRGIGSGASGAIVRSEIEIDTPAVRMGVATDDGESEDSATATRFDFEYPVYLQNNTDYAIQIETDSTEYLLWSSKLGEVEKLTGVRVSSQPLLGSLYRSQNTDTWVEDLFEDLKFDLRRAKFDISSESVLTLVNDDLPYEKLQVDPFDTSASSNTNATSNLFKANNSVIKVNHRNHGFEDSGKSNVFFRKVDTFAGITNQSFTASYYPVDSVGVDSYTIKIGSNAGDTLSGGGSSVYATKNVKYEKLFADISYIQSPGTKIDTKVKTINVVPIDSTTENYTSYEASDFETTFLNEIQYFENQKFVCSSLNENINSVGKSLIYKLNLSSDIDYLSPLVDIRNISVKTSSTRVEMPSGQEDRYGKRYQSVRLWPVYRFALIGINTVTDTIVVGQKLKGSSSAAEGIIVAVNGVTIDIRMQNTGLFESGEVVIFSDPANLNLNENNIRINPETIITSVVPNFNIDDQVTVLNIFSNLEYTNIVDGKVVFWDSKLGSLTLQTEKQPINNDYTSESIPNSDYARNSNINSQLPDIFRVNDYITFDEAAPGTEEYYQIQESNFLNGIDYRDNIEIINTSSVSKYVTKESSLKTPAKTLDVRITANSKDVTGVQIYYRTLESSSQNLLSTFKWTEMPLDLVGVNFTKKDKIAGSFETRSDYQELKFYVNNLPEFTKYQIKIVLNSDDPVYSPKIQDLRVVASV